MPTTPMPAAEVDVDAALVRRLLASQFPHWADLPIEAMPSPGWDNFLFRLGSELLVRLPRRQMASALVETEHRWLPELAPRLPLPIPVPVGRGRPDLGYPWSWSVCPWLAGKPATTVAPSDLELFALALGEFVAALHQVAPPDGPRSIWRGVPLADRDRGTREAIDALDDVVDTAAVTAAWDEAIGVPRWPGPDLWVHGDLHPANLLVDHGQLSAVLDFGDLAIGDPAVDLLCGWMMLPAPARPTFRAAAQVDDDTWARGRGWAVSLGCMVMTRSSDNPVVAGFARKGLDEALADSRSGG
jgi:aminoglycoside phosphotransferase (APT) family kinase protein